ncbi:MAG: SAM-dependent methyltransferase [Steroidobacteraceae bacterium]
MDGGVGRGSFLDMSAEDRQSQAFFESRYQSTSDPWHFASSAYEQARYQATLDALLRTHYRCAYEPGCSVGVLTAALAQRCDRLIACDIAPSAVATAQARCQRFAHVTIAQCDLGDGPPHGTFDLIVFSEIGYYFPAARLHDIAVQLAGRLESGGEFVAVHWLGQSDDHLSHGDVVHQVLSKSLPLRWAGGERHAGFRIDSWQRT